MASFVIDEFVGNGSLKDVVPKLLEEGWDNIPTLKMMNSEDMDDLKFTQQQKEAFEIRSYLHGRALMQYGDKLEASGKLLPDLLSMSALNLSSEYGMRRGHIACFQERGTACEISMAPNYVPPARKSRTPSRSTTSTSMRSGNDHPLSSVNSRRINDGSFTERQSLVSEPVKIREGHVFKGIVAAEPAEARFCGLIKAPEVVDDVAPYSAIEKISVQKLAPEYKIGMERLVKTNTPPMKASQLWRDKPALLLCIRRPGCIMCRAEAHQLYSRKPMFDALGIQLIAVIHEQIDSEVKDFWPRYWGGVVIVDRGKDFFKALGGGKLLKDKFISGFVFNPRALANYKRAKAMGLDQTFKGEGEIKGGLFIVGSGKTGIAYQFIERNFGDWAPIGEVVEICSRLQKPQDLGNFTEESPEKSSMY